MGELDGRVAIVTGSSSGIGEATARRLADLGAHVVVNSASSVDAGRAVTESLPIESIYVQADISDQAQGQSLLDQTIECFGRLDILVNNAGWTTVVPHTDLDALTVQIGHHIPSQSFDTSMHRNRTTILHPLRSLPARVAPDLTVHTRVLSTAPQASLRDHTPHDRVPLPRPRPSPAQAR